MFYYTQTYRVISTTGPVSGVHYTAAFIVHPFFFSEEGRYLKHLQPSIEGSNIALVKYQTYLKSLKELMGNLVNNGIPIVALIERPPLEYLDRKNIDSAYLRERNFDTEYEFSLKLFQKAIKDLIGKVPANVFCVLTQPEDPTPLVSETNLPKQDIEHTLKSFGEAGVPIKLSDQTRSPYIVDVDQNGDFVWGERLTDSEIEASARAIALGKVIKSLAAVGLKKVLLSGTYIGGNLNKDNYLPNNQGGTSSRYEVQSDHPVYGGIVEEVYPETHPLRKIKVQGCAAEVLYALVNDSHGIRVGISNATFPETLPKSSFLSEEDKGVIETRSTT